MNTILRLVEFALSRRSIRGVTQDMNLLRLTAKPSSPDVSAKRPATRQRAAAQSIFGSSRQAMRALTAALLAAALAGGTGSPAFAQDPGGSPPAGQQQQRPALPTPPSPEQNRPNPGPHAPAQPPQPVYGPGPSNPPIPVSLGVSKYG